MDLDLGNWSERQTYFLGRFYDLSTQLFLRESLREGETCIDIGANIGMMTLLAARCVGRTGLVLAFEPNPEAAGRIRGALEANNIKHVWLFPVGLSDSPAKLQLRVLRNHSGFGTFAEIPDDEKDVVTTTYDIDVVRGDDVVPADLAGPAVVKIDVEGFEAHALRGLEKTLTRLKPAVVMELVETHLARAGSSGQELFDLFVSWGYRGYALRTHRKMLRYGLELAPIARSSDAQSNGVAWLHPEGPHLERLRSCIR